MKEIHSGSATLERHMLILLSPFSWIPSEFTTLKFYWIDGVVQTKIPLTSTSNIGHSVDHTSITNALIETKVKMVVVWDDIDEEVGVLQVDKAAGEVKKASKYVEAMVAVYEAGVASEGMEIQAVQQYMSVKMKDNINYMFIFGIVFIKHQAQAKIQVKYIVGRFYCADCADGMNHTPPSTTCQEIQQDQYMHTRQPCILMGLIHKQWNQKP